MFCFFVSVSSLVFLSLCPEFLLAGIASVLVRSLSPNWELAFFWLVWSLVQEACLCSSDWCGMHLSSWILFQLVWLVPVLTVCPLWVSCKMCFWIQKLTCRAGSGLGGVDNKVHRGEENRVFQENCIDCHLGMGTLTEDRPQQKDGYKALGETERLDME